MIDIYSLVQVAYRVSQSRTGGLTYEAQVALDVPRPLREPESMYGGQVRSEPFDTDQTPSQPNKEQRSAINPSVSLAELSSLTGYPEDKLNGWVNAIRRKRQAVFYGPPGTGKSFLVQQMAKHLVGDGEGDVEMIQFHQAYDYADFMEGIRPSTGEKGSLIWENKPGIFLRFSRDAAHRSGQSVFIIDEINRANLSRVFGELMLLLEYREKSITLASGESFSIPSNVILLGTMNTADHSLATVDQAMRRRFAFIHLPTDVDILRRYHAKRGDSTKAALVESLIEVLEEINSLIDDPDRAFGISYFMTNNLAEELPLIWETEIEPLLADRFYSQPLLADSFSWRELSSRIDR